MLSSALAVEPKIIIKNLSNTIPDVSGFLYMTPSGHEHEWSTGWPVSDTRRVQWPDPQSGHRRTHTNRGHRMITAPLWGHGDQKRVFTTPYGNNNNNIVAMIYYVMNFFFYATVRWTVWRSKQRDKIIKQVFYYYFFFREHTAQAPVQSIFFFKG